ncbi:L-rhamnose mutarotase [Marispirochaeta aestuarii]|uniref:L-rhamnose mutarotase n=1 Tax=Marispirochaeta aestuarii TaxID=1963862 RepID=UPI0029C90A93|nr:L-rhamnose mutarotase [Marispirochaeta aestuarii]
MDNTIAFKMKLKPGKKEEYRRRHKELWPELAALLKENGVYDYYIFLDEETNILFAVQKVREGGGSQSLGDMPVVRKWWHYMAELMEVNPDESPVSVPLEEMFHLP